MGADEGHLRIVVTILDSVIRNGIGVPNHLSLPAGKIEDVTNASATVKSFIKLRSAKTATLEQHV